MRPFRYLRVADVESAVNALATERGARLIAGGTTMVDLMRLGVEAPELLIDISGVDGLALCDLSSAGELVLGALAPMSDPADHTVLRAGYPALGEALAKAVSPQLRNVATLGGNLLQRTRCPYFRGLAYRCNKRTPGSGCAALHGNNRGHAVLGTSDLCVATYPGDWAVALAMFDACVDVTGLAGCRSIPVADLHRAPDGKPDIDTVLARDEVITRIRVPKTRLGRASTYHKVRDRTSYAFALASAAVALDMDGDVVREARIAVGGVATRPWRCTEAEAFLKGAALTEAAARRAGEVAFHDAVPLAGNVFKVALGAATVAEGLMIAKSRAREAGAWE